MQWIHKVPQWWPWVSKTTFRREITRVRNETTRVCNQELTDTLERIQQPLAALIAKVTRLVAAQGSSPYDPVRLELYIDGRLFLNVSPMEQEVLAKIIGNHVSREIERARLVYFRRAS